MQQPVNKEYGVETEKSITGVQEVRQRPLRERFEKWMTIEERMFVMEQKVGRLEEREKPSPVNTTEEKINKTIEIICDWIKVQFEYQTEEESNRMEWVKAVTALIEARNDMRKMKREKDRYFW